DAQSLLTTMASSSDDCLLAPSATQLEQYYNGIAASVCRGTGPNLPPLVAMPSGPLNYSLGASAGQLDVASQVTDPDSANFNNGQLSIAFSQNGQPDDILEISPGSGISTSGANVLYTVNNTTTTIGSFSVPAGPIPSLLVKF